MYTIPCNERERFQDLTPLPSSSHLNRFLSSLSHTNTKPKQNQTKPKKTSFRVPKSSSRVSHSKPSTINLLLLSQSYMLLQDLISAI
ncbi:hypothetical protein QVD17_27053 [Tagetes erecta]|uniref:Uncharacterized protein n=1 Tax=Tagetes erecta TaxID=13708 RepID=A0AAD8NQW4_TARER|nr:hypothetical protein QVD17_27053 [Tagetes erecta]